MVKKATVFKKIILLVVLSFCISCASMEERCMKGGNEHDCFLSGTNYLYGRDVNKDFNKAFRLLKKGCEGKEKFEKEACTNLGYMYYGGMGIEQDIPSAIILSHIACKEGSADGCHNLATSFRIGERGLVDIDNLRAKDLFEKACLSGVDNACGELGIMYMNGLGTEKNYDKAFKLLEDSCNAGNDFACTNLALLYISGKGVSKNEKKAEKLLQKSCKKHHTACSLKKYKKECDQGEAYSCYYFGDYLNRDYVIYRVENYDLAANFYEKACFSGIDSGCSSLAKLYIEGRGVKKDMNIALNLLGMSCDDGRSSSCKKIAELYEKGEQIPQNPEKSLEFYKKSCEASDEEVCKKIGNSENSENQGKESNETTTEVKE